MKIKHTFDTMIVLLFVFLVFTGCTGEQETAAEKGETSGETVQSEMNNLQAMLYQEARFSTDVSDYSIPYYQVCDDAIETTPVLETDEPFSVTDFGPKDELPSEVTFPSIYVVFSQPVVPLSKLGRPRTSSDVLNIDPPVQGVYRWYGTRMLSCDITERLLPQREYRVTVQQDVTSLGGKSLEGETSFSFRTEYLSLRDFFVGVGRRVSDLDDVPLIESQRIHLVFSYPVELETIEKYIAVHSGNRPYSFEVRRPELAGEDTPAVDGVSGSSDSGYQDTSARQSIPPIPRELYERAVVLHMKESFSENTQVQVIIKRGARSTPESLGTPEPIVRTFHTLTPFRFTEYDSYSWSFPRSEEGNANPIYLTFSHPPAKNRDLHSKITITPHVDIGDEHIQVWGNTVKLNQLFQPESTYVVILGEDIEDVYGRSLGKMVRLKIETPEAKRYAYFPNTGTRVLEAQFPHRIVWEMQNVFDGEWIVDSIRDPYDSFQRSELYPFDFNGIERNVRHFEVLDLDPWLNEGGKGFVGMAWNFEEKRNGTRPKWGMRQLRLQVTDLAVTTRYGYNAVLVLVTSLKTGEPVANAEVSLLRAMTPKATSTTDSEGVAEIRLKEGQYAEWFGDESSRWKDYIRIEVRKDDDHLIFEPNSSHNHWRSGIWNTVYPKEAHKPRMETMIFSDRGLYRPGETMRFKGIDMNLTLGNYTPYQGNYSIDIGEATYKGAIIMSMDGRTTESGGFTGTVELPDDLDPGYYSIVYERDGETARETFQVANFRRLRFSVSAEVPDITYFQGDKLSVNVSARYLAGGAVANGSYECYWYKEPTYFSPPGKTWRQYRFGPDDAEGRTSLGTESGVLPATGTFSVSTEAAAEGIEGAAYRYEMEARVMDVSNQMIADRTSITVHPADYYIGARLSDSPEQYWMSFVEKGEEVAVELALVSPDGELMDAQVGRFSTESTTEGTGPATGLTGGAPDDHRTAYEDADSTSEKPGGAGAPAYEDTDSASEKPGGISDSHPVRESMGQVLAELYHITWKSAQQAGVYGSINTRWERVEEKVDEQLVAVNAGRASFSVTPKKAGMYTVRITGGDTGGRKAVTEFSFYSTGADFIRWGGLDSDQIELKPDKKVYTPGETAKLLVQSPLREGRYLITVERDGIIEKQVVTLDGSANLIDIPVKESYLPVVYVSVAGYSVRSGEPTHTYFTPDLDKPKGYFGITPILVDTSAKRVDLDIDTGPSPYRPGGEAEVVVTAMYEGQPLANAEVMFVAADRGVLDLIDYHIPDPVEFFFDPGKFPLGVRGADSRSLLIDPVTYEVKDLKGGDAAKAEEAEAALEDGFQVRKDFRATAVFEPFLTTDENGQVTVRFSLPDTLTTYRCTAVLSKKDRFGFTETELQVNNPINLKTAFPRKLRERDTAIGSAVITNIGSSSHEVTISAESDLLDLIGETEKTVTVPGGETVEVPFRMAAVESGTAEVVLTLVSEVFSEKLKTTLEVEKPYVYESFTTIGKTSESTGTERVGDEGVDHDGRDNRDVGDTATGQEGEDDTPGKGFAGEGLIIPSEIEDGIGGLFLTLDATRLAGLKGALEYLTAYPFGCMEQRASRLLPYVLFGEYMVETGMVEEMTVVEETIAEELAFWADIQRPDGGFPLWPENPVRSSYYISLRIAHCLHYAMSNGIALPDGLDVEKLLEYLRPKEQWIQNSTYLMAYGYYVRSLFGQQLYYDVNRYFDKGDVLGISGYGLLGLSFLEYGDSTMAEACLKRIGQFIRPGTQTVDVTDTAETRSSFYDSQIEQLSLALMLYSSLSPDDVMGERLLNTIIQRQKGGYWQNTADNNWVVQALYIKTTKEGDRDVDFEASVTLDTEKLIETRFLGQKTGSKTYSFDFRRPPINELPRETLLPLQFSTVGSGTLYYTATLRYALPAETLYARDEGLSVLYRIEDLHGNQVDQDLLEEGKTYRGTVTVVTHKRRNFVALRVPVPSGCEILDSSFLTTARFEEAEESQENTETSYWGWYVTPVKKIMDNEVRYFWDDLPKGKQEVSFLFRATSAGVYPTPPVTAECMYEPEIFGRSKGRLFFVQRRR